MKTILTTTLFFLLFTFSSCITSLQPLVTFDRIVTDKKFEGIWIGEEASIGKGIELKIEMFPDSIINKALGGKRGYPNRKYDSILVSKSYNISYRKDSNYYYMSASLIQLGENLFMDLSTIGFDFGVNDNDKYTHATAGENLPTYTIAKLIVHNTNSLQIQFLNGEFIKKQVLSGKVRIKHESNKLFDMFLITASSRELQQFLVKYGNDERLYNKVNKVILKRKA